MRRALALWFTLWVASACANGGATTLPQPPPAASPTADVAASALVPVSADANDRTHPGFQKGPDAASASHARAIESPSPVTVRSAAILSPTITSVPAAFAIAPMATRAATTADLDAVRESIGQWSQSFIAMLQRRRHPQPGVDPELDLRNMVNEQRVGQVIVRSIETASISGETTLALTGWTLNGGLMRAWGSPAFMDITIRAHDQGPLDGIDIAWRMRVQAVGFWFRAFDLFDPATATWMIGEAPRYTPVELDTELRWAAQAYLGNESYSPFRPVNGAVGNADTAFWRVRSDAITALNRQVATGALIERYFENVSARIERFEPAWFGGDGVVTAILSGRLVETLPGGRQVRSDFSQRLRFLRTPDGWTAVDAQEGDGSWDSAGNLGLAEIAKPHG